MVPARVRADRPGHPVHVRGAGRAHRSGGLASSCRANRGPATAPLLLVNHWINTDPVPRPSHAAVVNAYEPLLARARACERERERGTLPNPLTVDFYRQGDLFRVVDTLNRVDTP